MQCYNGYSRLADHWENEQELKEFKIRRYEKSTLTVLEWLPFRAEFNELGFADEMLKTAIVQHFGHYNKLSERRKEPFDKLYLHWFTDTVTFNKGQKLQEPYEQVSGIFSETQERISYQGCKEIHEWVKVDNLIEYRIQTQIHLGSLLLDILETKYKGFKKFDRKKPNGTGLGSFYGSNAQSLKDYSIGFRTKTGQDIDLNFVDIAKGDVKKVSEESINKMVDDYKDWRKEQMSLNDKELEEWIKDRGTIYVYDGKGHEKENLVKEYIPTIKQERAEWEKDINDMKKLNEDPRFNKFLELLRRN